MMAVLGNAKHPEYGSATVPLPIPNDELKVTMAESDAEILLPHVNLYTYGEALLQSQHAMLTEYGVIERQDGQPMLLPIQQSQEMGMNMK